MQLKISWSIVVVSVCTVYCAASYIFLRYPLRYICVAKPSKIISDKEIIAHRGGCNEAPENTFTAIKHATKHANICEVDIQFTKDNVPVLFHDKYLNRLIQNYDEQNNKEKISICDLNWNDVNKLRLKNSTLYIQDTFYSKMKHRSVVSGKWGNNESIPKLEDILKYLIGNECTKKLPLIIDMQQVGNKMENVQKLVDLIHKYKYMDKVILFDDTHHRIRFITDKYKEHKMETVMPIYQSCWIMLSYLFGLLPFIPYKKHSIIAICSSAIMANYLPSPILWLYNHWILTPKFINHLKNRQFKVYFMTIDNESDMKHCFNYFGFNGVLTDCPRSLKQAQVF